jgi:hypothetical protein
MGSVVNFLERRRFSSSHYEPYPCQGYLQDAGGDLPAVRAGPALPHPHRLLRHSPAQPGPTSPPDKVPLVFNQDGCRRTTC